MDPLADKILVCSAFIAFVGRGWMPAWMVVIVVARELAITGLRLLAASKNLVLAAEGFGKHKTISQIVAIISILVLHSYQQWGPLGAIFGFDLFGGPWIVWFTTALNLGGRDSDLHFRRALSLAQSRALPGGFMKLWIAQGFGIGRIAVAPGTFGSVLGLGWLAVLLSFKSWPVLFLATLAGIAVSVWLCGEGERILGRKDPGSVVLDEIVAIPLCFAGWMAVAALRRHSLAGTGIFLRRIGRQALEFLRSSGSSMSPSRGQCAKARSLPGGWGKSTIDDVLARGLCQPGRAGGAVASAIAASKSALARSNRSGTSRANAPGRWPERRRRPARAARQVAGAVAPFWRPQIFAPRRSR